MERISPHPGPGPPRVNEGRSSKFEASPPRRPPLIQDAVPQRQEVRLLHQVTAEEGTEASGCAQYPDAVLQDLPQEGFPDGRQVDQVDGAPRGLRDVSHQHRSFRRIQGTPRIHRQVDVALKAFLTESSRPEKNRELNGRVPGENALHECDQVGVRGHAGKGNRSSKFEV